jgi:LysM repeat protein
MNTTNPFQVPTCLQRAHVQQRRQNRLKKIVIGSVAAATTLLIFLLVEGCMSEHAKSAGVAKQQVTSAAETLPLQTTSAPIPVPAVTAQPKPLTPPAAVAVSPLRGTTPRVLAGPATYYVVKSGDTLARIAKQYHVPVKTIMATNNLSDDHITVGAKLKLPTA